MANPTTVNSQIIDAVTMTNVSVLANAPAMAMASLYQTIGNSVAMAATNAVYSQNQANMLHQAVTAKSVARLFQS